MIASTFPSLPISQGLKAQGTNCSSKRNAFTLIEMLVVMCIMGVLSALASTAISSLNAAGDFNNAVSQINGVLDEARAYAMAKNTFVFVGVTEVNAAQSTQANPQVSGIGRVVIVTLASRDGTRGFDINSSDPASSWSANYNSGGNLSVIQKPLFVNNIDLPTQQEGSTGNMNRPQLSSTDDLISSSSAQSQTPLAYPLGSSLGSGQYTFNRVIYFDPKGVPHFQMASTTSGEIDPYFELDFQPIHGNSTPAQTPVNVAAILVDGMTGASRIYRP